MRRLRGWGSGLGRQHKAKEHASPDPNHVASASGLQEALAQPTSSAAESPSEAPVPPGPEPPSKVSTPEQPSPAASRDARVQENQAEPVFKAPPREDSRGEALQGAEGVVEGSARTGSGDGPQGTGGAEAGRSRQASLLDRGGSGALDAAPVFSGRSGRVVEVERDTRAARAGEALGLDTHVLGGYRSVRVGEADRDRDGRAGLWKGRIEGSRGDLGDSPSASSGLGSLPPGIEATPDQSEDGRDLSVSGLLARVAQLEKQVAVLTALTAPLLNGETALTHNSAFSNPLPTSTMYRLQLAGGSLANSRPSSFTDLPEAWGGVPPAGPGPPVTQDREEVVHMAATRVVMHQIVTPADVDPHGICPGGQVLSWIDIAAGLAAKTVARGPVVTASVDSVQFLRPCRLGSTAIIAAMVNRIFSSSMEVGVRVEEEVATTGERFHCCSAYLTFVAVLAKPSARGPPPRRLPRVVPNTPYLQEIWESADRRRRERLERRQLMASQPELSVPRLQPLTHREGSPTLAPAIQVGPGGAGGRKAVVAPSMTLSHMTQLIMPHCANSLSICFGGQVMKWMEQCAYIAASRVNRGGHHLLTGSMDSVMFKRPTRVGDIMYITGQVTAIFGSSMEVMISVCGETPHIGEVFHCGDAYVTVVSVDREGGPVEVPFELQPVTEAERRQCAGASQRREERLAMRDGLLKAQERRRSLDGSMAWRGPATPPSPLSSAQFTP